MGLSGWPPPNPRIAPTFHPELAPPPLPPPKASSSRCPGTTWMAVQEILCRTCVCGPGNSASCHCMQDSRRLIDYGNRIDSEGVTKLFHSSESNSLDRVVALLKAGSYSASNCALPQVHQHDVYCCFDSTHESTFASDTKAHYKSGAYRHLMTAIDEPEIQRSTQVSNYTDLCISIPSTMEVPESQHKRKRGPVQDPLKITKKSKVNGNTLDSRSKDESKQLIQVRAKADKSSQEQEFPNATLLSDVSLLSSNYDDLYGSVSAPGKSLNTEAPDTYVHLRKRGKPETFDCSPRITKSSKVHGSKILESNLKDDSRKLTQVFVHFGDACISLQVNLKTTTVRKLIFCAMNRKGIRSCDAYLLYCGRVLEEAYSLSMFSIPKDASFRIIPRLRAGVDQVLITYKTFNVIIKDMKPFYKVLLPQILRKKNATGDVYMFFLSQDARVLVVQLLIYLSYLHTEGWCFNGKLDITKFIFWNGTALMHPDVTKVQATGSGCQSDMIKLGEGIEKMFKRTNFFPDNFGDLPGYVDHLVQQLKKIPIHKWNSKTYRLYLSNHPALLSFNERVSKYVGMDLQFDFMDVNRKKAFDTAIGNFGTWQQKIHQVEPLWDTLWHNPISSTQCRFGTEGTSWLAVVRNFFNHPNEKKRGGFRKSTVPVGFTKEQAEAAVAFYWKDNLARFLLNVIDSFRPPADMDIKLLCGNDLADPDSRGGKSGGTEVGQMKS